MDKLSKNRIKKISKKLPNEKITQVVLFEKEKTDEANIMLFLTDKGRVLKTWMIRENYHTKDITSLIFPSDI